MNVLISFHSRQTFLSAHVTNHSKQAQIHTSEPLITDATGMAALPSIGGLDAAVGHKRSRPDDWDARLLEVVDDHGGITDSADGGRVVALFTEAREVCNSICITASSPSLFATCVSRRTTSSLTIHPNCLQEAQQELACEALQRTPAGSPTLLRLVKVGILTPLRDWLKAASSAMNKSSILAVLKASCRCCHTKRQRKLLRLAFVLELCC